MKKLILSCLFICLSSFSAFSAAAAVHTSLSALIEAAGKGDLRKVEALVARAEKSKTVISLLNGMDSNGLTPLMIASAKNQLKIVEFLVKSGADLNLKGAGQNTALFFAVTSNHLDIVQFLVEHGAEVNVMNSEGFTPWIFSQKTKNLPMAEFLEANGANLDQKHANPETVYFRQKIGDSPLLPGEDLYASKKKAQKSTELALKYTSASEFSGALEWAHRKGFMGKNTNVLVLEGNSEEEIGPGTLASKKVRSKHAVSVEGIVREIAPLTNTLVYNRLWVQRPGSSSYDKFTHHFSNNTIINVTYRAKYFEGVPRIYRDFRFLMEGKNNLLVMSAGNDPVNLKNTLGGPELEKMFKSSPSIKSRTIIAGSVGPFFRVAKHTIPGPDKVFQENFLCALGESVPIKRPTTYETVDGTSLSAPAISGAAALLLSAHPDLSMDEIAAILLESAEKNFFIPGPTPTEGTFVCDKLFRLDLDRHRDPHKPIPGMKYIDFDPAIYGRGVLSLRRAFLFAVYYKDQKNTLPKASMEVLLRGASALLYISSKKIDIASATLLQAHTRGFLARKKLERLKAAKASHQSASS